MNVMINLKFIKYICQCCIHLTVRVGLGLGLHANKTFSFRTNLSEKVCNLIANDLMFTDFTLIELI